MLKICWFRGGRRNESPAGTPYILIPSHHYVTPANFFKAKSTIRHNIVPTYEVGLFWADIRISRRVRGVVSLVQWLMRGLRT